MPIAINSPNWVGDFKRGLTNIPPLATPPVKLLHKRGIKLSWPTAHRGQPDQFIDNSLKGISESTKIGVPLLEVDVRIGVDGTIFIFHDGKLRNHNFNGDQAFLERNAESLKDIERESLTLPGDNAAHIPKLQEVFDVVRGHNTALELDVKHESNEVIKAVLDLAKSLSQEGQILVQCEKPESVRYIQGYYPNVATLYRAKSETEIEDAIILHPTVVELEGWYNQNAIDKFHEADIRVLVNVAESSNDRTAVWEKLFEMGVDIIMTDRAADMMKWFRSL